MVKQIILLAFLLTPFCLPAQNRYDVVIDEIMADPTPSAGLPANEWIELKNISPGPVNLLNWRIGDASGQSGPMPNFTLLPDSFVIVCTGSAVAAMSVYGRVISVTGFPSLDNDDDQLFLKAFNGKTIHAVGYNSSWYRNEVKKDGGWTLEMTDPSNPCGGGDNWKASTAVNGGTPGRKNAGDTVNIDSTGPQLIRAYTSDSLTILLVFDEPLDSLAGASLSNYSFDSGLMPQQAVSLPPLFNQVQIKLSTPMLLNSIYTITASNITDCRGNVTGRVNSARTGLPSDPAPGEWVINEILFDPRSNAYDFAELYNNSKKILDASKLYIAGRNSSGDIHSVKVLSQAPFYIFPGDHIVITEDADNLALQYLVKNPGQVLVLPSPPSFPDDEGTVVALNLQGAVVDEVMYQDDWHFKLLVNTEGVSLERIDPSGNSQDPANWHSAASTAGYGTPTYANSQYRRAEDVQATVWLSPNIFSPDNDGRDDITRLQYTVTEPGYVANITIYDAAGRVVCNLVRNGTLGLNGYWNWDGLDDRGFQLPVGIYILFTEIFNLQGKKEQFKNTVVLSRKLH